MHDGVAVGEEAWTTTFRQVFVFDRVTPSTSQSEDAPAAPEWRMAELFTGVVRAATAGDGGVGWVNALRAPGFLTVDRALASWLCFEPACRQ